MRTVLVVFVIALLGPFAGPAVAASHISYDLTLPGIDLRPGVTADLHATVFVNRTHPCNGSVALTIHGLLHTAATWEPFVASLFEDNPAGRKLCRVVALDMPGRGGSVVHNLPWFGAVTLDDYVAGALGALGQLNGLNIRPSVIFGHSLGGLIVQLMQQRLISEGTDLRSAFGVKDVVLLASATPQQVPTWAIDSGMLNQLMGALVQVDPLAGTAQISDSDWAWLFFAPNPADPLLVVPGAPTPADVAARHYNSPEPLAFLGVLMNRPGVDAGIFGTSHETALTVVSLEHDFLLMPDEASALSAYLIGEDTAARTVLVPGFEAVHDTHVSNAALVLRSIAAALRFP